LSYIKGMKALLWASVIIAAILLLQPALDENYRQCKEKAYKWAASTASTEANCILFGHKTNNKAKFSSKIFPKSTSLLYSGLK